MSKEKLRRQFLVQVTQTLIAICIVFMVKTIAAGSFLSIEGYCTADIVLAFCSGYLSAFFSRWSEHWWDNVIFSVVGLLFSAILYGLLLQGTNGIVVIFVYILAIYYVISLTLEYIICPCVKSRSKTFTPVEYIGYIYREED